MPISFKTPPQTIPVKWSASHMLNNLAVHRASESRRSLMLGVSHKSGFAMGTISEDGTKQIQSHVICKAIADDRTVVAENDARFIAHVVQAAFVSLPARDLLVFACTKSVQIYEPDGTTNLHIHMLEKNPRTRTESSIYSRGIAGVGSNLLCVGNHQGEIFVFSIPSKGANILLKETIPAHEYGVTAIVSNNDVFISSDTNGTIIIWNVQMMLQIHVLQRSDESGITSLALWNNCLAAAYANGMIRIFDVEHADICGSIAAHARCINAIDCNADGLLVSVSDDCFVRMWRLSGGAENLQISHQANHRLENLQLVGVKFLHLSRADIAVSSYDSNDILVLRT